MRVFVLILLAISFLGTAIAQENGPAAEAIPQEITRIENQKVAVILKGGAAYEEWFNRNMDDDFIVVQPNGASANKTRALAAFRNQEFKVLAFTQADYNVRVYANGTTAVATYSGAGTLELEGKSFRLRQEFTDVWVKEKDGGWRCATHNIHTLSEIGSNLPAVFGSIVL
jgi:ketosteroid isomerase-like protein